MRREGSSSCGIKPLRSYWRFRVQTSVLLSIKPEFVEKIFSGIKKYEFRRAIFKSKAVSRVVVYASSPVQRVVGEFELSDIISARPDSLWRRTRKHSGIE